MSNAKAIPEANSASRHPSCNYHYHCSYHYHYHSPQANHSRSRHSAQPSLGTAVTRRSRHSTQPSKAIRLIWIC